MKIDSISTYKFTHDCGCGKPKPKNVSFGFGEDYGTDPSLEPEFNRMPKDPSTLKSLWLMVEIPVAFLKEAIQDAFEVHRETQKYKAKFKEQERQKKLEEEKSSDSGLNTDNSMDYMDLSA